MREALQRSLAERTWGKYHGPNCRLLAERLADYHGCRHVVLCSSGTVAVELALRALKVGPGHEVILAAYDFKGNFGDVLAVGAKPVLVDIHPDNWNFNPEQLENAIGPATKAIIVSHLHGGVVPMSTVMQIAAAHQLPVIEDACQMPGSRIGGRKAGMWGDVGILSFGGSKLLSAGRGGALLTNDPAIVQRATLYSHRGNEAYPLSELQASVLLPQMQTLDAYNTRRAENAALLCRLLSPESGLMPFRNADLPSESSGETTAGYYKLGFQYAPNRFDGLPRDLFAESMRAEGIALDPGFRGLHKIHSAKRYRSVGELPIATDADQRVLTLHHPVLWEGLVRVRQIVEAVEKIRPYAATIRESVAG